jgi:hypothetical protein
MKLENVNFVNLTPHEVVVYADGSVLRIPPSGRVARVTTKEVLVGTVSGVPVFKVDYGEVEGLPEPKENTIYIVSLLVLQALRARGVERNDVVAPNSGPGPHGAVRDSEGRIIGVRSFIVL